MDSNKPSGDGIPMDVDNQEDEIPSLESQEPKPDEPPAQDGSSNENHPIPQAADADSSNTPSNNTDTLNAVMLIPLPMPIPPEEIYVPHRPDAADSISSNGSFAKSPSNQVVPDENAKDCSSDSASSMPCLIPISLNDLTDASNQSQVVPDTPSENSHSPDESVPVAANVSGSSATSIPIPQSTDGPTDSANILVTLLTDVPTDSANIPVLSTDGSTDSANISVLSMDGPTDSARIPVPLSTDGPIDPSTPSLCDAQISISAVATRGPVQNLTLEAGNGDDSSIPTTTNCILRGLLEKNGSSTLTSPKRMRVQVYKDVKRLKRTEVGSVVDSKRSPSPPKESSDESQCSEDSVYTASGSPYSDLVNLSGAVVLPYPESFVVNDEFARAYRAAFLSSSGEVLKRHVIMLPENFNEQVSSESESESGAQNEMDGMRVILVSTVSESRWITIVEDTIIPSPATSQSKVQFSAAGDYDASEPSAPGSGCIGLKIRGSKGTTQFTYDQGYSMSGNQTTLNFSDTPSTVLSDLEVAGPSVVNQTNADGTSNADIQTCSIRRYASISSNHTLVVLQHPDRDTPEIWIRRAFIVSKNGVVERDAIVLPEGYLPDFRRESEEQLSPGQESQQAEPSELRHLLSPSNSNGKSPIVAHRDWVLQIRWINAPSGSTADESAQCREGEVLPENEVLESRLVIETRQRKDDGRDEKRESSVEKE